MIEAWLSKTVGHLPHHSACCWLSTAPNTWPRRRANNPSSDTIALHLARHRHDGRPHIHEETLKLKKMLLQRRAA